MEVKNLKDARFGIASALTSGLTWAIIIQIIFFGSKLTTQFIVKYSNFNWGCISCR